MQRSVATAFAHLYRMQTKQLNRPDVTEAQLRVTAACDKGDGQVAAHGPGNDWRCVVTWHLPGVEAAGTAIYQLDVTSDGRYVADGDGPKEVNGYFLVRTPTGDAPNPLWQFDGNVDLLPPPRRDDSMQVTRRRRRDEKGHFVLLGRRIGRRITLVTAGITAVGLAATGTAFAETHQFGTEQVGQSTDKGQVISSDQYIAPYGDRARHQRRQDHVVRGQPGRHPPRGLGHRRRRRADHRGPQDLEGAAARRQQRRGEPAHQRQRRGPGRPDVLARRLAAVARPDRRLHQVHRERRRQPRRPDEHHDPGRRAQARAGRPRRCSRPTAPPCTPRSTARTGWSPSTRRPVPSSRAGPWATPRAAWSRSAASSTSATRAGVRPSPATPRSTPTTPRCRPTR